MDLLIFLKVLARRLWLILAITLLAILTTYFITRGTPKVYKSTAVISTGITDKLKIGNEASWIQMEDIRNQFNNLLQAMTSRQAVSLLSYKLIQHDLNDAKPFRDISQIKQYYAREDLANADRVFQAKYNDIETLFPNNSQEAMPLEILKKTGYDYESLIGQIKVEREGESDYIKITVSSNDPFLSAFAANNFSKEFIRYYNTEKGVGTNERVDELKKMVDEKYEELQERQREMTQSQRSYQIIDGAGEGSSLVNQIHLYERNRDEMSQKVAALEAQLIELDEKLANMGSEYDSYNSPGRNPRLVEIRDELAQLRSRYLSSGSTDQTLKDSIDLLTAERQSLLESGSQGTAPDRGKALDERLSRKLNMQLELSDAQESLKVIESKLSQLYGRKYRIAEGSGVVGSATSAHEIAEKEYEAALQRYNDALETVMDLGKSLRVFEYGRPAERPEPSRAMLMVAFSGLASIAFSVVVLFLLEYIDLSIKTPSNFLRLTGLPLLGSLNHLNASSLKLESLFSDRSNNPSLEKYKQLLRKLRFEIVNSGARVLLYTSPKSGEGKTLTLISLAYSLSLNDKKILLIDTNFKDNSLTHLLQARPVLEDWIGRDGNPAEAVSRSELAGIDVIGCQGGDYSPLEVLYEDKFRHMIETLSHQYDYIFLEGPSLNEFSDSKELVGFSEKVIAVFSAKSTIRQSDKESIEYLQQLDDHLLGAILNDVEPQNLEV